MPDDLSQEEKRGFKLALRIISRKSRTSLEIEEALTRKGIDRAAILKSISLLEELGYLNDQDYAYNYAVLKASEKLWGTKRIHVELKKKRLPESVISEALKRLKDEVSDEETLEKALKKKIASMHDLSDARDVRRLFNYLARHGFAGHLIIEKMKKLKMAVPHEF